MASLVPGYEYDIFISYRQKDNKHDGWVTEFVNQLKGELESTFKEEISVYFDINPHDGILDTYDVDASLKDKLKCLVFIPIISRTYCDPKSFAWNNEFCAFNRSAKQDQIGRNVRLANGNVAGRILPVQIHDLDPEDKMMIEKELGGVLRPVEFIFKSPGINRPLKLNDERSENINHTYYPDQINKVANAIREIITAIVKNIGHTGKLQEAFAEPAPERIKKSKTGIIVVSAIVLMLAVLGYYVAPGIFKSIHPVEKSIAVLPFENMSNDPEQEIFSDGMMQEIMNHLFMISGLKIPSSTSSMRFKGSKLSIKEIARKLNVSYVLEGNVSRSGDNLRIIVRLVNGRTEQLLWTELYIRKMTATDLHYVQSEVAQRVAQNMKIEIIPEVRKRIENQPTENTEAYSLFLRVTREISTMSMEEGELLLQEAIRLDPQFADAYALLAYFYLWYNYEQDSLTREQLLAKVEPLINKALQLDNNSLYAHGMNAELRLFFYWDLETAEKEYSTLKQLSPSNPDVYMFFYNYLISSGRSHEALNLIKKDFSEDDLSSGKWRLMAMAYHDNGQPEKALEIIKKAMQLFPNDGYVRRSALGIFIGSQKYEEALTLFDYKGKSLHDIDTEYLALMGIAYFKTGNTDESTAILDELLSRSRKPHLKNNYYCTAQLYMTMDEEDKALQSLENAFIARESLMVYLNVDPTFRTLNGDPRFESLLLKMGFK